MDCIPTNSSFEFRLTKYVCHECKELRPQHNFLAEIGRDFMQRSSYIPDFTLEIQKEDNMPRISRRIKLEVLSTNFRRILIKKACTIINSMVKLGFAIAIRITRRNQDLYQYINTF